MLLYLHFICWFSSLHFFVICWWSSFTFPFRHHPLPFRGLSPGLHPFYTFSSAHSRVIRDTCIFNHWEIFLPLALRVWVGVFYPQAFFTLRSFTKIFDLTCIYQGLPMSQQFFFEGCRASRWGLKHRSGPIVCLNHTVFSKRYWSLGSI